MEFQGLFLGSGQFGNPRQPALAGCCILWDQKLDVEALDLVLMPDERFSESPKVRDYNMKAF